MHPCGLHFLLGKKGSGKSMIAVKMLIGVLIHTNRVIVTNLPLHMGELVDFIRQRYPRFYDHSNIKDRVTLITEAKILKRFWLTLGNDWWIPDVSKRDWELGQRLDYRTAYRWVHTGSDVKHRQPIADLSLVEIQSYLKQDPPEIEACLISELPPVQFIIDEIQNIFAARSFMQTSPGALFFLSQQRHLGADVIAISQNIDLVDKEFRDLADDFLFMVNWGRKQKSWFRLPKIMTWAKYDMKPGPGIKPMLSGTMRVDIDGLGQLYDTSAGVGIEGGLNADTKEKPPGIHWGWFILLLVIIGYWLVKTPGCIHSGITKFLGMAPKSNILQSSPAAKPQDVSTNMPIQAGFSPGHVKMPLADDYTNLIGLTILDGKAVGWFRNGRRISSLDRPHWDSILLRSGRPGGCRIDGTNFWLQE